MVEVAKLDFVFLLVWISHVAFGEHYLGMESSLVKFECRTKVTPIWMENEKTKSIGLAYGTEKRATFNNDR